MTSGKGARLLAGGALAAGTLALLRFAGRQRLSRFAAGVVGSGVVGLAAGDVLDEVIHELKQVVGGRSAPGSPAASG